MQMEYIRAQTKPRDGKLLAIGHSMGGILLYAMLSRYGKSPSLVFFSFCFCRARYGGIPSMACLCSFAWGEGDALILSDFLLNTVFWRLDFFLFSNLVENLFVLRLKLVYFLISG